jgi:hypothetical protein
MWYCTIIFLALTGGNSGALLNAEGIGIACICNEIKVIQRFKKIHAIVQI